MALLLRSVEADLQALSQEARRTLPGVKEAAERVLLSLRRDGSSAHGSASSAGGATEQLAALHSGPAITQLLHPFLFGCNHADAPKKVLTMSLSSIQRFVVADLLRAPDFASLLRVLEIQVRSRG